MNKTWTAEEIKAKLLTNDKWLFSAILAIFNKQTEFEQKVEETNCDNGVGFTGCDAKRLSYYAKWIKNRGGLTGRHLEIARKRMVKYAGQLARIANGKYDKTPVGV